MVTPPDLLPLLAVREVWIVGMVVVLAVLRPVGRLGWTAAAGICAAAAFTVAEAIASGHTAPAHPTQPGLVWAPLAVSAWILLAALLAATAAVRPLRWEPRTGPGAATALLAGAFVLHVGAAVHTGGGLGVVAERWASGGLGPEWVDAYAGGPLAWPLAWSAGAAPLLSARAGAALVSLIAVALVLLGADRLGRRWGHVGTARCTAAAVAWSPPLLLAHALAPGALLATAALVWSWWALLEVWGGRHRSGRLAFVSGALLGVGVGLSVWPLVVTPLWLRRLGMRTAAWFAVGFGTATLTSLLALVPTSVGLAHLSRALVLQPLNDGLAPPELAVVVAALALITFALRRPLTPTRLSALTAALLLATVPWWPPGVAEMGPVAAIPFVLLAAVAPDRPQERWPPDAPIATDRREEVGV